jgi:hypothetical protein
VRTDYTAGAGVNRTPAKGTGRNPGEYAGGAESCPWMEGHSNPPIPLANNINLGTAVVRIRMPGGVGAGGG